MEFKNKLVSVIIPVYNVEKYLDECLESVIAQSYKNLEIILVNDGSTDSSGIICDEWSKRDSRIRVIHKNNGGLSSARNAGLDVATGDYISFVDSDDIVNYSFIEQLLKACVNYNKNSIAACIFDAFVDGNAKDSKKTMEYKKPVIYSATEFAESILDHTNDNAVCSKLFPREIISNIRFKEGIINEDFPYVMEVLTKIERVNLIPLPLYYYRQRPGSITQYANPKLFDFIKNGLEIREKLPSNLKPFAEKYILYECVNFVSMITKFKADDKFKNELVIVNRIISKNIVSLMKGQIGYRQFLKLIFVKSFPALFRQLSR